MSMLKDLASFGLDIQSVDIRQDGITVSSLPTPAPLVVSTPRSRDEEVADAYDAWKAKQKKN